MNRVRQFEPIGLVHQAVRPVKPSVMDEEIDEDRQWQIPQRIIAGVLINPSPPPILPRPHDKACWHPVNRGTGERPENLAPDLGLQRIIQPRMAALRQPSKRAAGNQIPDADDQCHRERGGEDGKDRIHNWTSTAFAVICKARVFALPAASDLGVSLATAGLLRLFAQSQNG